MVSYVKQGGELIGLQDAFGPTEHGAHGLAVIVVGDPEIYGQVVFGIGSGLYIIGDFGDVVADDHLSAVQIRSGYLLLAAPIELPGQVLVFYLGVLLFG